MGSRVLLVEDTPSLQLLYKSVLARAGHQVDVAASIGEGLAAFQEAPPDILLLDVMLPDGSGLELMRSCLSHTPEVGVIVITANGSINKAVEAMRSGAYDFLVKPFDEQRLTNAVENAVAARRGRGSRTVARAAKAPPGFIGSSQPMRAIYDRIASVAGSMATVFVSGESGTGKEVCAFAVHATSPRRSGPFVPLNCTAIPGDLLESEVFGHLKGSFTGAISDKLGAAASADGGTLFLDEICEMDLSLQAKLLRFLQTSTIQPLGSTRTRKVNVRIICATNRDPMAEVRAGRFREDLYYRLHVIGLNLPPLRERGTDVLEIATDALRRFSAEEGKSFTGLSPEVEAIFCKAPWPGNVRQLLNVIRNVVVFHDETTVTPEMLPDIMVEDINGVHRAIPMSASEIVPGPPVSERPPGAVADPIAATLGSLAGLSLAEIERRIIEATLARHGGSVPKAARELAVSPSTLYRKLDAWRDG